METSSIDQFAEELKEKLDKKLFGKQIGCLNISQIVRDMVKSKLTKENWTKNQD